MFDFGYYLKIVKMDDFIRIEDFIFWLYFIYFINDRCVKLSGFWYKFLVIKNN